jgi:uncharacterized protein (DUF2141 family)
MLAIVRIILAVVICSFLVKCATIAAPQGGPKDTESPKLIASSTENYSTNFKASNIILSFDEYIKLDNPSQNVTTSPPLGDKINFTATKNKLFITFREPLEENITYHLNFGNSIVDVNEANPLSNFQYIFSTGDKIDSIALNGAIDLINDIKISKSTIVGLYRDLTDSAFYKAAPFYFTLAKEDGSFSFTNLKNGTYKIIALSDLNGNKYYDMPTEAVGFLANEVVLDSNVSNLKIPLFISEPEKYRIISYSNTINDYQIKYEFSKSIELKDSIGISFLSQKDVFQFKYTLDEDRRNVIVDLDSKIDSLKNLVSVVKINDVLIDTFQHSISNLKKPKQEILLKSTQILQNDSLIITTSLPVMSIDKQIAIIDTLKQDTLLFNSAYLNEIQLFINLGESELVKGFYTLLIQDSTFSDHFGRFNEPIKIQIEILELEDLGWLKFYFENADSSIQYILNFLDESEKLLLTKIVTSQNQDWTLPYLLPGKYSLQIIEDKNLNGVWNSGSIVNRTFPEKITKFSKEITIRPNWELEETINFSNP